MQYRVKKETGEEISIEEHRPEKAALLYGKGVLAAKMGKSTEQLVVTNPIGEEVYYRVVYAVEIYSSTKPEEPIPAEETKPLVERGDWDLTKIDIETSVQ